MGKVLQADLTETSAILTGNSLLVMAMVNVITFGLEAIAAMLSHRSIR